MRTPVSTLARSEAVNQELAISAKNLKKAYRIWRDPGARLKAPLWDTVSHFIPKFVRPKALNNRLSHQGKSRYYTDFYALSGIDLNIKKGESIGIIGRNGSGKSTLLQMLAGTLTPTEGEIKVHGKVAALLELGSGFNPEFTGRENVYLNASVLGLNEAQINDRLDAILQFADIGDFIDQPVKTYSSGMNMRLAFAVIAHVDADILIVDEAMAVGDVFFVQKCMRFIRDFRKKGTLLLVTHDTATVQSICDRAVWLHHGKCKAIGDTKSISEKYLEATYAEKQGVTLFKESRPSDPIVVKRAKKVIDQRAQIINSSNLRNDLKVFDYNSESSAFGANGAKIIDVQLLDGETEAALSYSMGGEEVIIRIITKASIDLDSPILGFFLKNGIGQELFGDNTYLSYIDEPYPVQADQILTADFHFQMPYLPAGDYSFTATIANGTQEDHVQHHWLHDALTFRSQSTNVGSGLIGMPMLSIKLNRS
jgi:lipopolysaccharide transport system ATP-binding protein